MERTSDLQRCRPPGFFIGQVVASKAALLLVAKSVFTLTKIFKRSQRYAQKCSHNASYAMSKRTVHPRAVRTIFTGGGSIPGVLKRDQVMNNDNQPRPGDSELSVMAIFRPVWLVLNRNCPRIKIGSVSHARLSENQQNANHFRYIRVSQRIKCATILPEKRCS
jgi:hypothetical protein